MIILSNYLFYLTPIASILTFIISLTIFLRPGAEPYLKYFSIFLFVNCCLDTGTSYMALNRVNNVFISNVNTMATLGFYLYLLMTIVERPKSKKVLLIMLVIYLLISMMNFFLVQKTGVFNSMTYCLGCLLIVTASIYYFWELFQQRRSLDLLRQPTFWICSGLLFYCACSFPLQGMLNFMNALPKVILENLLIIFDLLNILLYLSFSIAFLCRLKIRKSMSSF
jgi:hypothetical protein